MSKDLSIVLFIIVVSGLAISIPYVIELLLGFFTRGKQPSTSNQRRTSRMKFYSDEFEADEVFEADKIPAEPEEDVSTYSGNIYICPECGSLKLRMSEPGKIRCGDCQRLFLISDNMNQNFH
jgi:hypothetical protein